MGVAGSFLMFASRLTATFAAFFIAITTSTPLAAREAVTLDGYMPRFRTDCRSSCRSKD
jgi:hypothetical protein